MIARVVRILKQSCLSIHEGWCTLKGYCGWLNFRWIPIFMVFVEGPIHEFQYPWISYFLCELWRKILMPRILNPTNMSFLFNPRKLEPTKTKPSTVLNSMRWYLRWLKLVENERFLSYQQVKISLLLVSYICIQLLCFSGPTAQWHQSQNQSVTENIQDVNFTECFKM